MTDGNGASWPRPELWRNCELKKAPNVGAFLYLRSLALCYFFFFVVFFLVVALLLLGFLLDVEVLLRVVLFLGVEEVLLRVVFFLVLVLLVLDLELAAAFLAA